MQVIFILTKHNKNSLVPLINSIEDFAETRVIQSNRIEDFLKIDQGKSGFLFVFSFTSVFVQENLKILKKLKEKFKDSIFVAGGSHVSSAFKLDPNLSNFHFLFTGEGEISFKNFAKELIIEPEKVLNDSNSKIVRGRYLENLDLSLPFSKKHKIFSPIEIVRGCIFGCTYCETPRLFPGKLRFRSIESVKEIVSYFQKHNIHDIRFIAPDALSYQSVKGKTNPDAIYNLLYEIRKTLENRGRIFFGTFPSEVRPERINNEVVKILKQFVANTKIVLGLQSGCDRILKKIRRGHSVSDVKNAVLTLSKHGFTPIVDVMVGIPGESEECMIKTVEVSKELTKMGAKIHAHVFMPLPGTPLFYENLPEIPRRIIYEMDRLSGYGMLFGQWKAQLNHRMTIKNSFKPKNV